MTLMSIVIEATALIQSGELDKIETKELKMKHLVIEYFDTFPVGKYYFDTKEQAIAFAEKADKLSAIYEYEYRGIVWIKKYEG